MANGDRRALDRPSRYALVDGHHPNAPSFPILALEWFRPCISASAHFSTTLTPCADFVANRFPDAIEFGIRVSREAQLGSKPFCALFVSVNSGRVSSERYSCGRSSLSAVRGTRTFCANGSTWLLEFTDQFPSAGELPVTVFAPDFSVQIIVGQPLSLGREFTNSTCIR